MIVIDHLPITSLIRKNTANAIVMEMQNGSLQLAGVYTRMSLLVEKVCDVCQEEFSSTAAMKCHKRMHEAATKIFKEVILDPKPKCKYGDCDHSPEDHEAGVCWHIVDKSLIDVPDDNKFCGCHKNAELNHDWDIKKRRNPIDGEGWMDPHIGTKDEAIMITKVCKVCRNVLLIRVDSDACSSCRR